MRTSFTRRRAGHASTVTQPTAPAPGTIGIRLSMRERGRAELGVVAAEEEEREAAIVIDAAGMHERAPTPVALHRQDHRHGRQATLDASQ